MTDEHHDAIKRDNSRTTIRRRVRIKTSSDSCNGGSKPRPEAGSGLSSDSVDHEHMGLPVAPSSIPASSYLWFALGRKIGRSQRDELWPYSAGAESAVERGNRRVAGMLFSDMDVYFARMRFLKDLATQP